MARDDFNQAVRTLLAERAGHRCSHPECRALTSGPSLQDEEASAKVGVAAHIHGAAPNGPRYDPNQTPEERASASNGIWLCETHGKLVDSDESGHTSDELRHWKQLAEQRAKSELGLPAGRNIYRLRSGDQTLYINP